MQTDLARAQQPVNIQQAIQQIGINTAQRLKPMFDSNNNLGVVSGLTSTLEELTQAGAPETVLQSVRDDIAQAQTPEGFEQLRAETESALQQATGQTKSVSQREFETNVAAVEADPKLKTTKGRAAAIALGLEAKESLTAAERIAQDPTLADAIADVEGKKATATEEAKLSAQKKFKPQITRAVKLAEKEAAERGEVLTDLARMEASLPGVKEAVGQLIELSNVATSTLGGRAFDFLVKESGFGSTKGADARAKLIAIVDNQVLPLLKETFGAAFTVQEGENLKASLVDPNASPSQKQQQLDAFLSQKERNIRTKQTQAQQPVEAVEFQEGMRATNPVTGETAIFTNNEWVVQ